jgi:hypothetical protein
MQSHSSKLERIRQELFLVEGALHLRVRELGKDAVLDRTHGDYPLPVFASSACNPRSVFLDGHLQPKDDSRLVLVEYGHKASAVDDGDPAVQHVRHITGLPVDRPDSRRRDLLGKILFPLVSRKAVVVQSLPSRISDYPLAAARYAVRLVPGARRAGAGFVGPHSASHAIVTLPVRRPRRRAQQPMCGGL